jgi:hypothetical protein
MVINGTRVAGREDVLVLPFGDDGHPDWVTFRSYTCRITGRRHTVQKRDGMTRTVVG